MVTTRPPHTEEVAQPEVNCTETAWTKAEIAREKIAWESRPDPLGDPGEREIGGKVPKLSNTLDQTTQDLKAKVRPFHQRAKERHLTDLEGLFVKIAEHKLKPDPEKCVSRIEAEKLLGFLLTERDTEINPERCTLTRRISVLSGFASVGGGGDLPYQEGKEVFIKLKEYIASPPVLCKPQPSMPLSLYLAVIDQAISSVLVQKQDQFQKTICFVSRIWQEPEERYQVPEKATLLVSR